MPCVFTCCKTATHSTSLLPGSEKVHMVFFVTVQNLAFFSFVVLLALKSAFPTVGDRTSEQVLWVSVVEGCRQHIGDQFITASEMDRGQYL